MDGSGSLTMEELRALARRMAPAASEEELKATLAFLDEDGSNTVGPEVEAAAGGGALRAAAMQASRLCCALQR